MESETGRLTGRVALVTGASSGIGRAIALALSQQGARLYLVGRNAGALAETIAQAEQFSKASGIQADLNDNDCLASISEPLKLEAGLDILIHAAGIIHQDPMERARIEDFDLQFTTNVRAPYLLTQRLLPLLTKARGQVVFLNSSAGLAARRPEIGQYAATKHALKAVADSLREEVNPRGIRVLSIYLGRTATPMQKALHQQEGRDYYAEDLLQPEDAASVIVHSLALPPTAEITDISIRPMMKTTR